MDVFENVDFRVDQKVELEANYVGDLLDRDIIHLEKSFDLFFLTFRKKKKINKRMTFLFY